MKIVLAYILSSLFYFYFFILLLVFHVLQVVALNVFGDNARRKVIDLFNLALIRALRIVGSRTTLVGVDKVPEDRPIIIVSNHQSMFDIPAVGLAFKKSYPKFISKIELGKGIPSVSYNLKHGKSALIDRKKGSQAIKEIFKLGKLIQDNNYSACIFPEGTRTKNGKLKKFMSAGIGTLYRAAPSAVIVPFVVDGHYELGSKGAFPLNIGQQIKYTVLDPIEPKGKDLDELVNEIRQLIDMKLNQCT